VDRAGQGTEKPWDNPFPEPVHFRHGFIVQRCVVRSVFEPKSPRATPDVRDDFGFFSYDKNLQKIVWRQFHSEGFVNEYTLDSISADGHVLEFVTVRIETTEWAGRGRISGAFVDEPHAPRRGRLKNGNPPGDVSKAAVWS
jgi:hypothetical protein